MKKFISLAIVIVIAFTFCTSVFAEVGTYSTVSTDYNNSLRISGSTATYKSSYTVEDKNVIKVVITQLLEKQGLLWI